MTGADDQTSLFAVGQKLLPLCLTSTPSRWSTMSATIRPPSGWKPDALPNELMAHILVEVTGLEPATFCVQSRRSPW